ncbi:NUDIX hydrolase [Crocinitomix algicola]|uniref:NUDIX hydrolase n=1 Tax=Crocinitomix algicola TaxID=1740263 RepID=UPI000832ED3A|nr:NUDIX domain-containing protein [Crocinitomix algicola]
MYKVFIENKPISFHFNSQVSSLENPKKVWEWIQEYLLSTKNELHIELVDEAEFWAVFTNYKFIEAAGGLVERENRFLFIKRNGFWDIPKGKLEGNETPEIGAIREIEEECGLESPKIKEHLIDTYHTYQHKGEHILKKTYWFWLEEGEELRELIPQTEEGITEVAYFGLKEFDKIRSNTYTSILAVMDCLEKKMN